VAAQVDPGPGGHPEGKEVGGVLLEGLEEHGVQGKAVHQEPGVGPAREEEAQGPFHPVPPVGQDAGPGLGGLP